MVFPWGPDTGNRGMIVVVVGQQRLHVCDSVYQCHKAGTSTNWSRDPYPWRLVKALLFFRTVAVVGQVDRTQGNSSYYIDQSTYTVIVGGACLHLTV